MTSPSSTQTGAIAENLVANALMIESGGRLSTFRADADDDGIDLLLYDKDSGKAIPAQVKSRTVTLKNRRSGERGDICHFELRIKTYRADRFAAAILVKTTDHGYSIECSWVVPMTEFGSIARRGRTKYVIRASRSSSSRDRFTRYRCHSTTEMFNHVAALLAGAPSH